MSRRGSNKPVRAICARSGIEAYLHEMVEDGYIKGIFVLPKYYCPPQPVKFRLPPELPAYNPQPLNDVYEQVVQFIHHDPNSYMGDIVNPPYCLIELAPYSFERLFRFSEYSGGSEVETSVGMFAIDIPTFLLISGVESDIMLGNLAVAFTKFPFGQGGWGEGPYQAQNPGLGWGNQEYGVQAWAASSTLLPDSFGASEWGVGVWMAQTSDLVYSGLGWGVQSWAGKDPTSYGIHPWGTDPYRAYVPTGIWSGGTYSQDIWPAYATSAPWGDSSYSISSWAAGEIQPYVWGEGTYSFNNWSGKWN